MTLAISMITTLDEALLQIVGLSLRVSLTAVAAATLIGLPLGAAVAALKFPGRRAVAVVLNTMMGLPPVVVGLLVYLLLSRSGPFGVLGLLFTPTAMIVAQTVMIVPIIASLSRQTVEDLLFEYDDVLRVTGAGPFVLGPGQVTAGAGRCRWWRALGLRPGQRRAATLARNVLTRPQAGRLPEGIVRLSVGRHDPPWLSAARGRGSDRHAYLPDDNPHPPGRTYRDTQPNA